MNFTAIIPARYASTRFPAKPLALLAGKPIVQHVYERTAAEMPDAWVATDDERIAEAVRAFGGNVVMTSPNHRSGTDRIGEAVKNIGCTADVIVNVQGDEPFIAAQQLQTIKQCFDDPETEIATLVKPFAPTDTWEKLSNPNSPKVVVDNRGFALYFSRSVIPFLRGIPQEDWTARHEFLKHIGLYAYRAETLQRITAMPQGVLEQAESLEQLRWLQAGLKIKVGRTDLETIGIDTPEDLEKAEAFIKGL